MTDRNDERGGRVLHVEDGEATAPTTCRISGCSRDGVVSRKLAIHGDGAPPEDHYVCRHHYRVFWGVRIAAVAAVAVVFLLAFFHL